VDEKINEITDKDLYDKTEDLIDNKNGRLFQGEDCGFYMLENLPDEKNLLLYAHNLKYDFRFLFKYLTKITNIIINGSKIMSCSATYTRKNNKFKNKNYNIIFRDKLQMINKISKVYHVISINGNNFSPEIISREIPRCSFTRSETFWGSPHLRRAAVPTALAIGAEEKDMKPGDKVVLTGFGSGLNALFLGIEW
jgi:hypothetical protein